MPAALSRLMPGRAILSLSNGAFLPPDTAPIFRAPWEAQAFALTVAMYERGLFTWVEWSAALAAEIKANEGPEAKLDKEGAAYYQYWLAATEKLVAKKGIASTALLAERAEAWDRATHATPHGAEIRLEHDPMRAKGR